MYRIYTEDTRRSRIKALANVYFPNGFTMLRGEGCWRGNCEKSLIIEVSASEEDVRCFADALKVENHQEAVLVQRTREPEAVLV